MDPDILMFYTFSKLAADWVRKQAILDPGQLLTRAEMVRRLPSKRWRSKDYEDDQWSSGRQMARTAPNPAFD